MTWRGMTIAKSRESCRDMERHSFKVAGIGAETRDEFFIVPEFSAGERVAEAAAHAVDRGGPVATALAVLQACGHECVLVDGEPARAVILVRQRDGARQIVFMPSSSPEPVFEPRLLEGMRLLHINGRHENACRAAIRAAQARDIEISFDGGAGRWREPVRDLFEASHVRIVSRDFAEKCARSTDLAGIASVLLKPPPAAARHHRRRAWQPCVDAGWRAFPSTGASSGAAGGHHGLRRCVSRRLPARLDVTLAAGALRGACEPAGGPKRRRTRWQTRP